VSRRGLLADRRLAALFTGGSSGTGAAIVGELAASLGCTSCHRTVPFEAEYLAPIAMDVSDDAVDRQAFTSFAEFVGPAGLVNNAGAHHSMPSVELGLADVRDLLAPSRISVVRLAQLAHKTGPNSLNSSALKDDSIRAEVPAAFLCKRIGIAGRGRPPRCPSTKSGMRILGGSNNNY
jgi:NAD(P)-dependent dehydrogenase (short-subunit alcohol dehydrogenase family)